MPRPTKATPPCPSQLDWESRLKATGSIEFVEWVAEAPQD